MTSNIVPGLEDKQCGSRSCQSYVGTFNAESDARIFDSSKDILSHRFSCRHLLCSRYDERQRLVLRDDSRNILWAGRSVRVVSRRLIQAASATRTLRGLGKRNAACCPGRSTSFPTMALFACNANVPHSQSEVLSMLYLASRRPPQCACTDQDPVLGGWSAFQLDHPALLHSSMVVFKLSHPGPIRVSTLQRPTYDLIPHHPLFLPRVISPPWSNELMLNN